MYDIVSRPWLPTIYQFMTGISAHLSF